MIFNNKILNAFAQFITVNNTVQRLSEELKDQAREVKAIDRRVIRLETLVEIAEKQRKLNYAD